jgi:hypothetical protein
MDERRGTRWGRASVPIGLGLVSIGAALTAISHQVVALDFTVENNNANGEPTRFASSAIYAQNVGFGMTTAKLQSGTTVPVLRAGFATARLDGLCVSRQETIGPLTVTLTLRSGDGNLASNPSSGTTWPDIAANNATFDLRQIRGMQQSGQASNGINLNGLDEIGISTQDIQTTPGLTNPLAGPSAANWVGISGTSATFYSVKGYLYDAAISGNIALPKLSITTGTGGGDQCWSDMTTTTDLPQ